MNPILKNILAVLAGILCGGLLNMALVKLGYLVLPIEGIDPNDMEALAEKIPELGAEHFIFPFLAHALGTALGAFVAYKLAASHKMKFAWGIGVFFLLGGIMASQMLPAPTWFIIVDLCLAYLPMAYLGGKLAGNRRNSSVV